MTKTKLTLSDTHLVILRTASSWSNLDLLPLPAIAGSGDAPAILAVDGQRRARAVAHGNDVPALIGMQPPPLG